MPGERARVCMSPCLVSSHLKTMDNAMRLPGGNTDDIEGRDGRAATGAHVADLARPAIKSRPPGRKQSPQTGRVVLPMTKRTTNPPRPPRASFRPELRELILHTSRGKLSRFLFRPFAYTRKEKTGRPGQEQWLRARVSSLLAPINHLRLRHRREWRCRRERRRRRRRRR